MGIESGTVKFLKELTKNNNREWFLAHKAQYEGALQNIKEISEQIRKDLGKKDLIEEAKVFRIYKDVRFAKDKRPYKDHLDLWLWHGETRGWDRPGFFLRLTATELMLGVGLLGFTKPDLERYRDDCLLAVQAAVKATKLKHGIALDE